MENSMFIVIAFQNSFLDNKQLTWDLTIKERCDFGIEDIVESALGLRWMTVNHCTSSGMFNLSTTPPSVRLQSLGVTTWMQFLPPCEMELMIHRRVGGH